MSEFEFPTDFVWGTATSAYQVEGAIDDEGRGPSIWDTFSHKPGKIHNNDTGDIACDHYHRYQDDINLMKALNTNAYRFSVAWPRVMPEGRGPVNPAGLGFYDRLVDALLEADITPYATLYHWDLPECLSEEDGWCRRGIVDDYLAYTDAVTRALGDRVRHWMTFNEPHVFTWLGYVLGLHAPGEQSLNLGRALTATHHVYLSHGAAIPLIRRNVPEADVGIVLNLSPIVPENDASRHQEAAERSDLHLNQWYLEPLFKGTYPADALEMYGRFAPEIHDGDMAVISTPVDFLGVNYYNRQWVGHSIFVPVLQATLREPQNAETTAMDWEIYPRGLYDTLVRVHEEYAPPAIYVTENGAAFDDTISDNGEIHDKRRVTYLRDHFEMAAQAIDVGVPLRGYFVWSLLDNFEWAEGYGKRFGVVHVDYETQTRTIKDSGHYLAQVASGQLVSR